MADCLWGEKKISARRFITLTRGLSQQSLLVHTLTRGWSNDTELLATVAELLDFGNRSFALTHGVKKHELPESLKILRPNEEPVKKRAATREEVLAIIGGDIRQVREEGD